MNKITIYTCGKNFGKYGSGFSIILRSKTNEWKRSFSYGNYSANQSEMLAIKFSLLSISDSYKNTQITINSHNKYVRDMLEKDEDGYYIKVPRVNKEILKEIRNLVDQQKQIKIINENNDLSKECAILTEKAVKKGELINIKK